MRIAIVLLCLQKGVVKGKVRYEGKETWVAEVLPGPYVAGNGYIARLGIRRFSNENRILHVQHLPLTAFTLYYCLSETCADVSLKLHIDKGYAVILLLLKGTIAAASRRKKVVVRNGQVQMFATSDEPVYIELQNSRLKALVIVAESEQADMQINLLSGGRKADADSLYKTFDQGDVYMDSRMYDLVAMLTEKGYDKSFSFLYEDICRRLLAETIGAAWQVVKGKDYKESLRESLWSVKQYLDTHLDEYHTTVSLANRAGLNTWQLKKGFKAMFGKAVYTYLKAERMRHASVLLHETKHSIKRIAKLCGYKTVQSFSRSFKAVHGKSPGKVRKQ